MTIRMLTTDTRRRIEAIIDRIAHGHHVSLEERIQLQKYSTRIPFVAGKLSQALRKRDGS